MKVSVTAKKIGGEAEILSSKSELHRLIILAALCKSGESTRIYYSGEKSEDVTATAECMNAIAASVVDKGEYFEVTPYGEANDGRRICVGESGSTVRFLLPVLSALGVSYEVEARGRLPKRPLSPLREIMEERGVSVSAEYPLRVKNRFIIGDAEIAGNVSSQFISGLLMALPLCGGGAVTVTGDFQSKPYVDITVGAMRAFGADVQERENVYVVGGTRYASPGAITAGGDWSNAAFFAALGAIGGEVKVAGLDTDSKQGDKAITELLARFGAETSADSDFVRFAPSRLRAIEVDVRDIPDLVPALAIVAALAEGKTVIKGASRLRIKESDRIKSVTAMLGSLGIKAEETDDGLIIEGAKHFCGGVVDSYGDHRIVMAASIAAARSSGAIIIEGAQAVKKSYPQFFAEARKLGIEATEVE